MPRRKNLHWNAQNASGRAACGRLLENVAWSKDPKDIDCDTCLRVIAALKRENP